MLCHAFLFQEEKVRKQNSRDVAKLFKLHYFFKFSAKQIGADVVNKKRFAIFYEYLRVLCYCIFRRFNVGEPHFLFAFLTEVTYYLTAVKLC